MEMVVERERNLAQLSVRVAGHDLLAQVKERLFGLRLNKTPVVFCFLNLFDPHTPVVAATLQQVGFFFTGVLPGGMREGDAPDRVLENRIDESISGGTGGILSTGTIFREYGYGASEGLFTIPLRDETSAGVLVIHGIFFEFLPEATPVAPDAPTRLAHELEVGQHYQLVLTTAAGLYRYCLGDLVEVNGFLGQAPQVTFLRKVGGGCGQFGR